MLFPAESEDASEFLSKKSDTPLKFNMEPENNSFQIDFPFPGTSFQVPC